jgi:hypothetical protein
MADITPQRRTPRIDMVRSMLADRDSRSETARGQSQKDKPKTSAEDRRKLWQERLSQYVREPARH